MSKYVLINISVAVAVAIALAILEGCNSFPSNLNDEVTNVTQNEPQAIDPGEIFVDVMTEEQETVVRLNTNMSEPGIAAAKADLEAKGYTYDESASMVLVSSKSDTVMLQVFEDAGQDPDVYTYLISYSRDGEMRTMFLECNLALEGPSAFKLGEVIDGDVILDDPLLARPSFWRFMWWMAECIEDCKRDCRNIDCAGQGWDCVSLCYATCPGICAVAHFLR
jgi:hypothetical protein